MKDEGEPWRPWWPGERFKSWLESYCLRGVRYTYERDPTFKMGEAHSHPEAVCPKEWSQEIMSQYCNLHPVLAKLEPVVTKLNEGTITSSFFFKFSIRAHISSADVQLFWAAWSASLRESIE